MAEVTEKQMNILKHSTGFYSLPFHRNVFVTEKNADNYADVMALVDLGLMRRGKDIISNLESYHVNDDAISMLQDLLELANNPLSSNRR